MFGKFVGGTLPSLIHSNTAWRPAATAASSGNFLEEKNLGRTNLGGARLPPSPLLEHLLAACGGLSVLEGYRGPFGARPKVPEDALRADPFDPCFSVNAFFVSFLNAFFVNAFCVFL